MRLALALLHIQLVQASLDQFLWPVQWSGEQEIHLVSGKYAGAVQVGRISYDWTNKLTREDQALIRGPSVKTSFTSNNMTEWFNGTQWWYMDWTTMQCQSTDFGWGQVKPDFLIVPDFPKRTGSMFIWAYLNESQSRDFVNTSWIQTDGSSGFNETAGSSLFEWYIDAGGNARRMRMPSTLASDMMVEIKGFEKRVLPADYVLPSECGPGQVKEWVHGPKTPLALRSAAAHLRRRYS